MTDKEVLSQDEIDALLTSVDQEDVSSTGVAIDPEVDVRPYDLTSQDRAVRGRLPTLELLGEKFARQLRIDLQNLLKYQIEVGAGGVQILDYGEYITTLYVPTSITIAAGWTRHGDHRCKTGVAHGGSVFWWRWQKHLC